MRSGFVSCSESRWTTAVHPLRAPINKYTTFALLEDELIDEQRASPTRSQGHERDLRVETGSPRKKLFFFLLEERFVYHFLFQKEKKNSAWLALAETRLAWGILAVIIALGFLFSRAGELWMAHMCVSHARLKKQKQLTMLQVAPKCSIFPGSPCEYLREQKKVQMGFEKWIQTQPSISNMYSFILNSDSNQIFCEGYKVDTDKAPVYRLR